MTRSTGIAVVRSLRIAAFAAACWLAVTGDVYACSCVGDPAGRTTAQLKRDVTRQLDAAFAVFVGEPIAMNTLAVRFRVESVWKGEIGRELVMSTGAQANPRGTITVSSCDFTFQFGQTYLVFGVGKTAETMTAHDCSFTGGVAPDVVAVLDNIAARRAPSLHLVPRRLVAVIGNVKNPGLIEWRAGLTVAEALEMAGGPIPAVDFGFPLPPVPSVIRRSRQGMREEHPPLPTAPLLPDDELIISVPPR